MAKTLNTSNRRRSRFNPALVAGLALMGSMVLVAVLAPLFLTPAAESLTADSRLGPSTAHWFGTDEFGRDILARSLVATRLTLLMSLGATVISVVGGIVIGSSVWLAPRWIREPALRLIEAAVAYPSLIFALLVAAIMSPGSTTAVIAIGIAGIPSFARITANLAASIAHRNYIATARLLGVPGYRIVTRHLLPNMSEPLFVMSASAFALSLLEISSLSFVGLGVQSPQYDFGRLLNEGLIAIFVQPLQVVAPSIMLVITGLAAVLIGDGMASAANPRRAARRLLPTRRNMSTPESVAPASQALLEVDNLKVLGPTGEEIVKGVSFNMKPGEVLGLVGESGSGKSLTAMSIAGLLAEGLTATAHTLRLGDLDLLTTRDSRAMALNIGLVYQDPGSTFNPALRMGPQLTEVSRVHLNQSRQEANATMIAALDEISIQRPELRMTQHPHELSGGMLQRSMIAASTVTEPRLIIADEPTTALDVTVQADVLRKFRRYNQEHGTAILFISHDIGVVQELCDTVLVMHSGRILERLTGAELKDGRAEHPYTRALLSASPSMTGEKGRLRAAQWKPDEELEVTP